MEDVRYTKLSLQNNQSALLRNIKVVKDKERLRKCQIRLDSEDTITKQNMGSWIKYWTTERTLLSKLAISE